MVSLGASLGRRAALIAAFFIFKPFKWTRKYLIMFSLRIKKIFTFTYDD